MIEGMIAAFLVLISFSIIYVILPIIFDSDKSDKVKLIEDAMKMREHVNWKCKEVHWKDADMNLDKDKIIKDIEDNFYDMKKTCKENNAECLISLFRDYTDEIIKIIKEN